MDAVHFRRGIDGLALVCHEVLAVDPFSGTVFVGMIQKARHTADALELRGR